MGIKGQYNRWSCMGKGNSPKKWDKAFIKILEFFSFYHSSYQLKYGCSWGISVIVIWAFLISWSPGSCLFQTPMVPHWNYESPIDFALVWSHFNLDVNELSSAWHLDESEVVSTSSFFQAQLVDQFRECRINMLSKVAEQCTFLVIGLVCCVKDLYRVIDNFSFHLSFIG